ncbi:hypothetical protein BGX20_008550 [Mortierella sp. AD010]|nr:hypothetical protein BGX20_008550 [Mortierella sp. AD010]
MVDSHTEAEESANTNEGGSGAMDKSPIGDLTDGQAIRSNRQRRRKAGGVINVPASSRSLLSKASTSSLSSAWNDERAHGHDLEQEHLGHGSEQSRPGDDALEVESRSSASASSTNIGGLEAIKDSDQDPQDKDSGDGIA